MREYFLKLILSGLDFLVELSLSEDRLGLALAVSVSDLSLLLVCLG